MKHNQNAALAPYRVLDLTEGESLLAGRLMADLGAEVIQIERPGGSPSRNRRPFYKDIPHPEKSLFWFGYCLNKKSITLDIETEDGQELFKKLVASAHFVIESFDVGYLDNLGLGYQSLQEINPGIIVSSITPFGQTGPKAHYKWAELVGWACSDTLYPSGDPDRAPIITAIPLAYQQAAMAAVQGALTAHMHRKTTGEGQQVDVSIQEVMEWVSMSFSQYWPCHQMEVGPVGWAQPLTPTVSNPQGAPCKDGYVANTFGGGAVFLIRSMTNLHKWIEEEGMLPDEFKGFDWRKFDTSAFQTQEELDKLMKPAKDFIATKTKVELWKGAIERGILMAPVRDFQDCYEDEHLKERGFWVSVEHPELETTIDYPGAGFKMEKSPVTLRHRAPLIGEHNTDVYEKELGLSNDQMQLLKASGVI